MKQYNILWLFSDQHRSQAMGVSGDSNAKTPNLDALANQGMVFENMYTISPLCAPARASYYTGKYIHQHGVNCLHKPPLHELKMLPEMLKEVGYQTTHIGKWHLSGGAAPCHFVSPYFRPGWDTWIGWENSNRPFATEYSTGPYPTRKVIEGYQTDGATDFAIQSIEEMSKKDNPWFLVLSVEPPHDPRVAPEEDMALFENMEIAYRPNVPEQWKTPENEKEIRGYYAQIWNLDKNIGRIISKLKELGEYENTIIMYFSDHGDFMGSHGKKAKFFAEEESAKIPFIVYHPDMKKRGNTCSDITSSLDITKTTLAFAGYQGAEDIYGNDLSQIVLEGAGKTEGYAIVELDSFMNDHDDNYCYRAIIDESYVYVKGRKEHNCKLYDRKKDEFQFQNVLYREEYREIVKDMHNKLINKLKEIDDPIYKEWE